MLNSVYLYNDELSNNVSSGKLSEYGYSVWKTTLARADGVYSDDRAADFVIDGIWNNTTAVFDFGSSPSSPYVLGKMLYFIYENNNNCDVRTADSAYIPPN